ncbi:MAG: MBL fold metallo-hydrolase [Chlamydiota bacterium]|nr:MBL fold metallo-hydrolase [Chlamydiota bacterium]
MKVTFIKSASAIIEFNGTKVLCDPWMTDGIYYGSWYHYPPLNSSPSDFSDVDYIYISHIHPDHMDKYTLEQFPKNTPILIHDYQEKFLLNILRAIGFTNIIEVAHKEPFTLSNGFTIEILAADNCDPTACGKFFGCPMSRPYTKTMQIDSLAVFNSGNHTVVNTNDCQYELAHTVCDYIVEKYEAVDFALVGYSSATAYPQCFESLSTEKKVLEKLRIRDQFLQKAISYVKHLNCRYFLPFAGQYVLGGKLHTLNRYRSPPHLEELPNLIPPILENMNVDATMILLNSGEHFDIATSKTSAPFTKDDPVKRTKYIENVLSKKMMTYESEFHIPKSEQVDLFERIQQAHDKMKHYQNEYGYHSNWSVYIDAGLNHMYHIPFDGKEVTRVHEGEEKTPFVRIRLDYSLLVMILDKKAHWNNAEIGSHLTFYRNPEQYEVGVFRFLSFLHN